MKRIKQIFLSVLVFTIASLVFVKLTAKADSLITFNEGTGTAIHDSEGNTLGTITNAVWKQQQECISGSCLYFDGTGDYVSFGDDADFDFVASTNFTIEFWFRTGDITAGTRVFVSKYRGDDAEGGYKVYMNSTGTVSFGVDDDNSWGPDGVVTSTNAYDDNSWHHVVATKTGTTNLTLYVDAVRVSQNDSISTIGTLVNDDPLAVGIDADLSSNPYTGYIDELKIFTTTARTETQVKTDYQKASSLTGTSISHGPDTSALNNGLSGYWQMDQSAWTGAAGEVTDTSGNNRHGTITGSILAIGKFGNSAFAGDATSGIDTGTNTSLDSATGWTYSVWINPTTTSQNARIMCKNDNCNNNSNGVGLGFFTGGHISARQGAAGNDAYSATSDAVSVDTWTHIVAKYSVQEKAIHIYINGQEASYSSVTTIDPAVDPTTYASNLFIGNRSTFDAGFYGYIDEARVYSRELSTAEITQLYNFAPGPVGHWKVDENTGTDAGDSSGNGNNLTLTNSPTWTTGKFGSAVAFAGSNTHLIRTDDPDFDFADDASATWALWFKHSTASAQEVLLSKYNEAGYKVIMESDGDLTCALDYDNTWSPTDSATSTAANYDDDTWHHVSCVKSGATSLSLYIDGVLITSDSSLTAANALANSDPLYIGIDADATSNDFVGSLDDIKIYNYARTPSQLVEDLNAGHPLGGSPIGSQTIYWKLDEQTGSGANSINNSVETQSALTGNMSGALWLLENSCKVGGCLNFDGQGDSVSAGDVVFTDSATALTTSLWLYPVTLSTDDTIISKGDLSAGESSFVVVTDSTNADEIRVYIGDGTNAAQDYVTTTNLDLSVGSTAGWQHLAMVYDGSAAASDRIKVFRNGIQVTTAITGVIPASLDASTSTALTIGDSAISGSEGLIAYYDEIKIYSAALTSAQVLIDHNAGSASALGGVLGTHNNSGTAGNPPIAWWKFDENTGTSAFDVSGHNLTLTNSNSTPYAVGKLGSAANFVKASENYFSANDSATLSLTGDLTVQAWIRPSAVTASTLFAIAGKWDEANESYLLAQYGDEIRFYVDAAANYVTTNSTNLTANTWYHVSANYNAAAQTVTIYVNGVLQAATTTGTIPASIGDDAGKFSVGAEDSTATVASADYQPAASADDGRWAEDASTYSNTANGMTGRHSEAARLMNSWYRYTGVTISGTVTSAYITFGAVANVTGTISNLRTKIFAEDADNPSAVTSAANGNSRVRTTAGTDWDPTAWVIGNSYQSPSIVSVLQELVDTYTISNEAIQIFHDDDGSLANNTYIQSATWDYLTHDYGPILHVEYTTGPNSFYDGRVDDLKIYDYTRTPAQTAYDYNRGQPLGLYKFDECTGTTLYNSAITGNDTTAGVNGTLNLTTNSAGTCGGSGSDAWYLGAIGKFNSAISLDGDDYISATDTSAYAFNSSTQNFSVFSWVKRSTVGAAHTVISKEDAANDGWQLIINADNTFTCKLNSTSVTSTATVDTSWHQIGCVIDRSGNGQTYLDGQPTGSAVSMASITMAVASTTTSIGTNNYTTRVNYFSGLLDDLRIYNFALTSDQIKAAYNSGFAVRY